MVLAWVVIGTIVVFKGDPLSRIWVPVFTYVSSAFVISVVPWTVTIGPEELTLGYLPFGIWTVRVPKDKVRVVLKARDMMKDPQSFKLKAALQYPVVRIPGVPGIRVVYLSGAPIIGFTRRSNRMLELLRSYGYRVSEV